MPKRIVIYDEGYKRRSIKYQRTLKQIIFRVKPEVFERWEAAAKAAGYPSMRKFYMDAVEEKIARQNVVRAD